MDLNTVKSFITDILENPILAIGGLILLIIATGVMAFIKSYFSEKAKNVVKNSSSNNITKESKTISPAYDLQKTGENKCQNTLISHIAENKIVLYIDENQHWLGGEDSIRPLLVDFKNGWKGDFELHYLGVEKDVEIVKHLSSKNKLTAEEAIQLEELRGTQEVYDIQKHDLITQCKLAFMPGTGTLTMMRGIYTVKQALTLLSNILHINNITIDHSVEHCRLFYYNPEQKVISSKIAIPKAIYEKTKKEWKIHLNNYEYKYPDAAIWQSFIPVSFYDREYVSTTLIRLILIKLSDKFKEYSFNSVLDVKSYLTKDIWGISNTEGLIDPNKWYVCTDDNLRIGHIIASDIPPEDIS